MPTNHPVPARLTDDELLVEVPRLAAREGDATADLLAGLAELDERKLYVAEGCASLFAYCTKRLHLLEDAAWYRVEAARAVQKFPVILERMKDGTLTLTAVRLLARHLTADNCERLLAWAAGRTKREIEEQVAAIAPRPDVPSSLRKLPAPRADVARTTASQDRAAGHVPAAAGQAQGGPSTGRPELAESLPMLTSLGAAAAKDDAGHDPLASADVAYPVPAAAAARPGEIRVLAPARYSLRLTMSADMHAKLQRARALMRHQVPSGDPATVLDHALTLLVEHLERKKFAARKPRPRGAETGLDGPRGGREAAGAKRTTGSKAPEAHASSASAGADSAASQVAGGHASPRSAPRATSSASAPSDAAPPRAGCDTSLGSKAFEDPAPSASARPASPTPPGESGHASPRSAPSDAAPLPAVCDTSPARRSRYIPAAVRRAVWERDQGQCAFVGRGVRCSETAFLEFHHRVPHAEGGPATVSNLMLVCRVHNGHESTRWFGADDERMNARCATRGGPPPSEGSYPSRDG